MQRYAVAHPAAKRRHIRIMSLKIPVAHDFICPWCWVGIVQAKQLTTEFGVEFDWLGYELFPLELEWPDWPSSPPPPENKALTPTRFEFILLADDMEMPTAERPRKMRTYNSHEAVEFAKTEGSANQLVEALYDAYWLRGENINEIDVLKTIAKGIVWNLDDMAKAIEEKRFKDKIIGFDDPAYESGVYNVPTFFIGGKKYAEQPLSVLRKAVRNAREEAALATAN